MTVNELSQLYYLKREIKMDKERLEELRLQASAPSSQNITGMPSGGMPPGFNHKIEGYLTDIIELEKTIQYKMKKCINEQKFIEKYISTIPDSLLRQIFTLRFICGKSWRQIAFDVGGGNTEGSVKMACYRYLKSN